jgi:GNAT superfamily N-acetyltransferase
LPDVILRPATPADEPALGRLGGALMRQHHATDPQRFLSVDAPEDGYGRFLVGLLDASDDAVLVAERDGEVVGYVYAALEPLSWKDLRAACAYLHDVYVLEAARGARVGERLVQAALDWAHDRGAPRVVLMRMAGNEAAERLFARFGFRPTMVEMTRELDGPR